MLGKMMTDAFLALSLVNICSSQVHLSHNNQSSMHPDHAQTLLFFFSARHH